MSYTKHCKSVFKIRSKLPLIKRRLANFVKGFQEEKNETEIFSSYFCTFETSRKADEEWNSKDSVHRSTTNEHTKKLVQILSAERVAVSHQWCSPFQPQRKIEAFAFH